MSPTGAENENGADCLRCLPRKGEAVGIRGGIHNPMRCLRRARMGARSKVDEDNEAGPNGVGSR